MQSYGELVLRQEVLDTSMNNVYRAMLTMSIELIRCICQDPLSEAVRMTDSLRYKGIAFLTNSSLVHYPISLLLKP